MKRNKYLTIGMERLILKINDSEEKELEEFDDEWWVGNEQVDNMDALQLLQLCLIKEESYTGGHHIFTLHPEAVQMLTDPSLVPRIVKAMKERRI